MTAHLISRAEVDAEQQEWEQSRLANREIVITDNGSMVLRGVNLRNFEDVVGLRYIIATLRRWEQ